MADTKHAPHGGYSPDMDGPTHEATYRGFIRFVEIGAAVVVCWVLALAVGGMRHAWLTRRLRGRPVLRRRRGRRLGAGARLGARRRPSPSCWFCFCFSTELAGCGFAR